MPDQNTAKNILRLGLPKGSLQEPTLELFKRAGYNVVVNSRRGIAGLFELFTLLDEPGLTRAAFLDGLAERTAWNRTDLDFLTGPAGFDLAFPADVADGQFLLRLKPCFAVLAALGVSAQQATSWAAPGVNVAVARAIKQAVRANVGVSLISRRAIEEELAAGALSCVRVEDLPVARSFYLARHKDRSRSPLAEAFRAFVEEEAR